MAGRVITIRPVRCQTDPTDARTYRLLCQEAVVLAVDFGLFEEVVVEAGADVEDLDTDEAVVFPVQRDEPAGAGQCGGPLGWCSPA
jgi:hypothetical protein